MEEVLKIIKNTNLEDIIKISTEEILSKLKKDGFFPEDLDINKFSKIFTESLYTDKQEKKRLFYRFGRECYKNYVHFYTLIDAIDFIEERVLSSLNFMPIEIIKFVWDYFEFIKNQISYGYLVSMVKSDKDLIRKELKSVKGKSLELKDLFRDYLVWANKISEDIKKLRLSESNYTTYVPVFNSQNGKFSKFFKKEDFLVLKDIHNRLINLAFIIYTSILHRKFIILTPAYMEFVKLISKFISLASVNIAVKYSEENKIDPLTGVFNRRALDIIFPSQFQIAQISNKPLSIGIIDIDDFKKINDTYGHIVGDCVLKRIADELKNSLRESDFIFRYGGEEFLILFPFTKKEKACKTLNRILERLKSKSICCLGYTLKITFSGGVEGIWDSSNTFEMIEKADEKLYQAKRSGKAKVIC
ncbi:MAG: hypothetical protein DSY53_00550 [Persephonella sp.]|nr:MAG: hypothetical protein DSY53_00550 [Persephonella sp.]